MLRLALLIYFPGKWLVNRPIFPSIINSRFLLGESIQLFSYPPSDPLAPHNSWANGTTRSEINDLFFRQIAVSEQHRTCYNERNLLASLFSPFPPFFSFSEQMSSDPTQPSASHISCFLSLFSFPSFPQVVEYEGSNHIRNPEMQRVLLTHEVICRWDLYLFVWFNGKWVEKCVIFEIKLQLW